MSFIDAHHEPKPYGDAAGINSGVRCKCGEDFKIGRSMPDTPAGKPSRRKLSKMIHCWDAYRAHYAEMIVKVNSGVFTL